MAKAIPRCILLCALLAGPACYEPVPDHLQKPQILEAVWAADGDNFYISTRSRVIRWEDGAPVEVIYEGGSVKALGGTEEGLVALLDNRDVVLFDGSSWQNTLQPPRSFYSYLSVLSDAIYAVSIWIPEYHDIPSTIDIRSTIYRYDGVEWEVDFETEPYTELRKVKGRPDTGLWVNGWQVHDATDPDNTYVTPLLLRRGAGGWESLDSTYFGRHLVQSDQCEGDICGLPNLWVDLEGRAHAHLSGQRIFVHDGTQSWIEDSSIPATHKISGLESSRDGTVYAIAWNTSFEDSPAYLCVHDGTDWQCTSLGSDLVCRGLSAFDGGAIITACSYQDGSACKVGRVLRAWPDGVVQEIRSVPLKGNIL